MTTVSHSEVESLLLCERKWYYGYGLGVQRIKTSDALLRGQLGHKMLEVYYNVIMNRGSYAEALDAARTFLFGAMDGSNSTLITELTNILNMLDELKPFNGYKILAVEKEFVLEIQPGLSYPFVIDMIVKDSQGKVVVVDHKFTYDFYSPYDMALLPQIPKYIAALRALKFDVDYGMYHFLRYRKIKEPTPNQIIQTVNQFPNETRILRTFEEQLMATQRVLITKSMTTQEQSANCLRAANKMLCGKCSFNAICSAELSNTSPQLILQSEYKERERRVFEEEAV